MSSSCLRPFICFQGIQLDLTAQGFQFNGYYLNLSAIRRPALKVLNHKANICCSLWEPQQKEVIFLMAVPIRYPPPTPTPRAPPNFLTKIALYFGKYCNKPVKISPDKLKPEMSLSRYVV